jgi:hypothetical protein
MATREHRMAQFSSAEPPANQPLELLCEDHCGTYVIPFACRFVDGEWTSMAHQRIKATVIGWRRR